MDADGQLQQQGGTKWYDEKGGMKIVANRWDGANGETGILVWNADDTPAKVSVSFGGKFISANDPEHGEVDVDEPISANSIRLYMYRCR